MDTLADRTVSQNRKDGLPQCAARTGHSIRQGAPVLCTRASAQGPRRQAAPGFPAPAAPISPEVRRCTPTSVLSPTPARSRDPCFLQSGAQPRSQDKLLPRQSWGALLRPGGSSGCVSLGLGAGRLGLTSWADTGLLSLRCHHPTGPGLLVSPVSPPHILPWESLRENLGSNGAVILTLMKPLYSKRGSSLYH